MTIIVIFIINIYQKFTTFYSIYYIINITYPITYTKGLIYE